MNQVIDKLKLIYKPFLIIAITIIAGYTVLNWIIFKQLQLFSINETIINFGVPFVLPWVPILIWLRPRIKLLNLKSKNGSDLPGLYIFIAGFAMAIPTIIAQEYLETASGSLIRLDNIIQIDKQPASKYYSLKNFYIDKKHIGVQSEFNVSGKNNEYFDMNLYVAIPILASEADTANSNCVAWYGIKFQKQISNRLNDREKQEQFQEFANESQAAFDKKDVNQFCYFDRIGNTDDHTGYNSAVKNNKKYLNSSETILIPVNEPFESRNGNKLPWIFGSLTIGALIWLIMLLIPKFDEEAVKKFNRGIIESENEAKEVLQFFVPRKEYFITPIIIDLNILIYITMVFSGLGFIAFKSDDLLTWGGNFKPVTTSGEWWRLLTSTFLHGGIMHLFANMYGLLFVGLFLEPKLGKTKYTIVYLTTGIIASIASLYMHKATVSIGASGAIFGLYGVFLALLLKKAFPKDFSKTFLTSTLLFIGYNLLMGFTSVGIDNAAHIGGLVSGFVIGLILYPRLEQNEEYGSIEHSGLQHSDDETLNK